MREYKVGKLGRCSGWLAGKEECQCNDGEGNKLLVPKSSALEVLKIRLHRRARGLRYLLRLCVFNNIIK